MGPNKVSPMRRRWLCAIAVCLASGLVSACNPVSSDGLDAPAVPADWRGDHGGPVVVRLDEGGVGTVENFPLGVAAPECDIDRAHRYSGRVTWEVSDRKLSIEVLDNTIEAIPGATFLHTDWSELHVYWCDGDTYASVIELYDNGGSDE